MDNHYFLELHISKRALYYAVYVLSLLPPEKADKAFLDFILFEVIYDSPIEKKFFLYDKNHNFIDGFDVPRSFLFAEKITPQIVVDHKLLLLEFMEA
jgi:hypothetical protein